MPRRKLLRSVLLLALVVCLIYIFALDDDQTILNAIKHFFKGLIRAL